MEEENKVQEVRTTFNKDTIDVLVEEGIDENQTEFEKEEENE